MDFYAEGILRGYITEDGSEFRISGEGLPVEDDIELAKDISVKQLDDRLEVSNLHSMSMDEGFAYTVMYDGFQIIQMAADGTVTMVANYDDTLYYEAGNQVLANADIVE